MFNQNQKVSQEAIESRQESQIWTTFALSPYLSANDIKVSVREGKATLTGSVADEVNKDLAKQIALGVNGISAVDNNIEVHSNYMPPAQSEERAFGEVVEDATITATVKSKMLWSRFVEGIKANVHTTRGKVTLSGTADSAEAKGFAEKIAMNTDGVYSVDNQLVVGTEKSGGHLQDDGRRYRRRLDYHEGEIDLHVLQQRGWFRLYGQHQWRHRQAERQVG